LGTLADGSARSVSWREPPQVRAAVRGDGRCRFASSPHNPDRANGVFYRYISDNIIQINNLRGITRAAGRPGSMQWPGFVDPLHAGDAGPIVMKSISLPLKALVAP
jgi:hypothetical protein